MHKTSKLISIKNIIRLNFSRIVTYNNFYNVYIIMNLKKKAVVSITHENLTLKLYCITIRIWYFL